MEIFLINRIPLSTNACPQARPALSMILVRLAWIVLSACGNKYSEPIFYPGISTVVNF